MIVPERSAWVVLAVEVAVREEVLD